MHCLFTLVKIQKAIGSDLKQDFEVDRWASWFKYSPINWWEFAQMLDFVRNVLHNNFAFYPLLCTISLPSFPTCISSFVQSLAKSSSPSATSGSETLYSSSATTQASAKKKSVSVVMIAAGAVPARIASSSTAVVVEEPRVNGMTRILSLAMLPDSVWRRSMISPVFQS
jgi:hypothetical protein